MLMIAFDQEYGTPVQDALRRDITINALFYNVHSRAVEDHTGKVSLPFLWRWVPEAHK